MSETNVTAKARMAAVSEVLPDGSNYELLRQLAFEAMVERGLDDAEAGRTISHEEMGRRLASWSR